MSNQPGEPKPTIGRIVHYSGHDGKCRAAIVTEVTDPDEARVSLTVFLPMSPFTVEEVAAGPEKTPNSWHWPERA